MNAPSEQELQTTVDAAMRQQLERYGAASATVEALMHELRTLGLAALAGRNCKARLADVSDSQLRQVIERLERLRPAYPAITERLLEGLRGLL
jgi:hypothetical protein